VQDKGIRDDRDAGMITVFCTFYPPIPSISIDPHLTLFYGLFKIVGFLPGKGDYIFFRYCERLSISVIDISRLYTCYSDNSNNDDILSITLGVNSLSGYNRCTRDCQHLH
jgi:hypothetical protein